MDDTNKRTFSSDNVLLFRAGAFPMRTVSCIGAETWERLLSLSSADKQPV